MLRMLECEMKYDLCVEIGEVNFVKATAEMGCCAAILG